MRRRSYGWSWRITTLVWFGLFLLLTAVKIRVSVSAVATINTADETETETETTDTVDTNKEEDACGLYFALSSTMTDGANQWGVFAGHGTIKQGTAIIGTPDVVIHIPHLRANNILLQADNHNNENPNRQAELLRIVAMIEKMGWSADHVGGKFELLQDEDDNNTNNNSNHNVISEVPFSKSSMTSATPGIGFLAANDPYKHWVSAEWNVKQNYAHSPFPGEAPAPAPAPAPAGSGSSHPGRGASSPFFNIGMHATKSITPGSEIFVNYGSSQDLTEDDKYNYYNVLTDQDYERLDQVVDQMLDFFEKHRAALDAPSTYEMYRFIVADVMQAAVDEDKARAISSLLPDSPDDLVDVVSAGGSFAYGQPNVVRSLDWLKTYGRCMDTLVVGASSIPNAGRGAFAKRPVRAGDIVTSSPVLHIPDKHVLDMHPLTQTKEGHWVRASNDVIRQQLLLNYCYGHPESSMLFLPTAAGINLINHASHNKTPNAKLMWSSSHPAHHQAWFALPPRQLSESEFAHLGLLMDVIALHDIAAGEEVLIDYGPEWHDAWHAHEQAWQHYIEEGSVSETWPLRALDVSPQFRDQPFPTESESELSISNPHPPFPEHVILMAFIMVEPSESESESESDDSDDSDSDDAATAAATTTTTCDGTREAPRIWTSSNHEDDGSTTTAFKADYLRKVVIVDRMLMIGTMDDNTNNTTSKSYSYTVRCGNIGHKNEGSSSSSSQDNEDVEDGTVYVKNVPHEAFVLVDAPGTSDQFTPKAFRHSIGIPNDVFPSGVWRNLVSEEI